LPAGGELALIKWIRAGRRCSGERTLLGPGDDCAVLAGGDEVLLVTTDTILEGTHFDRETDPALVGSKAVNVSLSDLAAMAATPVAILVAATLPRTTSAASAKAIIKGVETAAAAFDADVVGGDVTTWDGPLALTTTAVGAAGGTRPVTRDAARAGDVIFVTGSLGGSVLGRHLRFRPRVREAQRLVSSARVASMIDLSDGLSTDLAHIARESGVGAVVEARRIPVSSAARRLARTTGREPLWHALHDGEDFELLFTVADDDAPRVPRRLGSVRVTRIGTVRRGSRVLIEDGRGRRRVLKPEGYEHRFGA